MSLIYYINKIKKLEKEIFFLEKKLSDIHQFQRVYCKQIFQLNKSINNNTSISCFIDKKEQIEYCKNVILYYKYDLLINKYCIRKKIENIKMILQLIVKKYFHEINTISFLENDYFLFNSLSKYNN